jgi:hypothetical protein
MKILIITFRDIRAERCQDRGKKTRVNNPMKEEQTNLKVATSRAAASGAWRPILKRCQAFD